MQSHRSTVPGSTSANSLKLIASKSSPDLDKTDKSLAATEKTSAPIVPSPAEQRQLEFVVADFSEADKKLADSLEEFQRTEFGFYVFESERNAPAKRYMNDWLKACCRSLDDHFTDLVTLVSRRPGINEQTAVYESERLVRGALLQHKRSPASTLLHTWKRFTVLGRLPFGIGEDAGRVGEKLTPFCFRHKKAIWTHLRRLREKELARIDLRLPDQRITQVDGNQSSQSREQFVRPILKNKGWSTLDWATQSKVDFHTADDYLKGSTKPHPSTRKKLADSLDIPVKDLPI